MIKLVIFDFDDTLSLTEEACFHLENETARRLGFAPMPKVAHLKNWGKPLSQAIAERISGIDPSKFMQVHKIVHKEFIDEGKVDTISEENIAFLDKIKASGKKLAILTSRSLQETEHLLQQNHPLNKRVEKFYHKDNTEFLKPDPRVFTKVLRDFNIKADEAVYVGDSLSDAVSAKSADLHFIAVLESGLRTRKDFKEHTVDFFANTLPEAINYISR